MAESMRLQRPPLVSIAQRKIIRDEYGAIEMAGDEAYLCL